MKAFVKKMRLPEAPKPTKPIKGMDPWELKIYKSLLYGPDMGAFKPKAEYHTWSDDDLKTLTEMWCEGRLAKDIAPKVGAPIKATQNKVSYMISKGLLPKRKCVVPEDECRQIREERKTMTVPEICRKHNVSQGKVKNICNVKAP